MLNKKIWCVLLTLVLTVPAFGQGSKRARLLQELVKAKPDTNKVNLYYSISRKLWGIDDDSVILMAAKGVALADSIDFKKGKALNYLSMGVALSNKGNYPKAVQCHLECLKLSEALNMEGLSGNAHTNLAITYQELGIVDKSLEHFNKALYISEKFGEEASCSSLINLSDFHTTAGNYALAKQYATNAINISRKYLDSANLAISLFNLSEIYRKTNQIDSARWVIKESLSISERINDDYGIGFCMNALAIMKVSEKKYCDALVIVDRNLPNLKRLESQSLLLDAYHVLYEAHAGTGNYERALHFRNMELSMHDSLFNIEKERAVNKIANEYELERKELQIQLLEKDNRLKEKEIARASLIKTIFGFGAVLLAAFTAYLIFSNIRWRNYHAVIKERNTFIQNQKSTILSQKLHLERTNALKDKVISVISHDFRSPLATLLGFLQLFKRDALTKEEKALATDRIEQSLAATLTMVENMISWGNSQRDGQTSIPMNFNIYELAMENIQLVQSRAEDKKVLMVNNIPNTALIFTDRDVINIVLRNLLSNAIKFSKPNDAITIALQQDTHQVIISVKDTGVGMSHEQQQQLFSDSINITTMGTANERGTGLGLALCYELVTQQGGKIWVESTLGAGSTFFFSIPQTSVNEL
jgi:signal transduction histidine kinase